MLTTGKIFKWLTALILPFVLVTYCHGQSYDPDKVNKKAADIYGRAYDDATAGNYVAAINQINEAIKIEPKFVDAFSIHY